MSAISHWLHQKMDSAASYFLERAARQHFEKYGTMLNFTLDTRGRTARFDILLKGETDPVTVTIEEFELKSTEAGMVVVIHRLSTSREWMNLLALEFVKGKEFPIPGKWAGLLRVMA